MKVLLVTDVPPCTEFSGAMLTLHLCRLLAPGQIVCSCVSTPAIDHLAKHVDTEIPIQRLVKPQELGERLTGKRYANARGFLRELRTAWRDVPRLARRIVAFGRQQDVDRVWCILQGQTMIRLALPVARGLGVPLLTQVWDHPSWWLDAHGVDPLTTKAVSRLYEKVLRQSTRIGAASHVMAREYERAYGVPSVPLMGSIDAAAVQVPATDAGDSPGLGDPLLIGLAGQIYSRREWNALLAALTSVSWTLGGRSVALRYLGREHEVQGSEVPPERLQALGYRSQAETLRLMAECDILYCPYFFDENRREISRTSFPSKVTTYLAAGRPVFFHGPEDAAPAEFLREYGAAEFCHSLEPQQIVAALVRLASDRQRADEIAANGRRAVMEQLTYDSLGRFFRRFLGHEAAPANEGAP